MNECNLGYCREVVELKAIMERVRAKLESVESMLIHNRASLEEMSKQLQRSRLDIASVKTSAAIWGGLSGAMLAALLKWMFTHI